MPYGKGTYGGKWEKKPKLPLRKRKKRKSK